MLNENPPQRSPASRAAGTSHNMQQRRHIFHSLHWTADKLPERALQL